MTHLFHLLGLSVRNITTSPLAVILDFFAFFARGLGIVLGSEATSGESDLNSKDILPLLLLL